MNNKFRTAIAASASALALAWAGAGIDTAHAAAEDTVAIEWDMPAQPLTDALIAWSARSNFVVLIEDDLTAGLQSPALTGAYTSREALERLLAASGLAYRIEDNGTLIVTPRLQTASMTLPVDSGIALGARSSRQVDRVEERADRPEQDRGREEEDASAMADEIVVTGTRIRGTPPTAPVHVVTRQEIERSGYGQIGDVVRSLPEVFGGGQNPNVIGASANNQANQNLTNASSVNLRGLGPDATLVLVNGRRLPSDAQFQSPDISGIPLGAVERIEIVTDGSSALYGSDAVAGVANFILRDDFDGLELAARLGGATQGGGFEQTYSGLAGVAREDWHALVNLEYADHDGVTAGQRDVTSDAVPEVDLLRPEERTSLFVKAGVDLTPRMTASLDALASRRENRYVNQSYTAGTQSVSKSTSPSGSIAGALDIEVTPEWDLNVTAGAATSQHDLWTETSSRRHTRNENDIVYAEATARGDAFAMPGGNIRIAVGGGWRAENYDQSSRTSTTTIAGDRTVHYLFGEAYAPLIRPSDTRVGAHELSVNLSGRYEEYSDFGTSFNPKIGLRYLPFTNLVLRGTWGESFKAPSFVQLYATRPASLYPSSALGYGGGGTAIYATGSNPDLSPEEATSWTLGADYTPGSGDGPRISATYFNIDYTGRIALPVQPASRGLANPEFDAFVLWDPTPDELNEIISNSTTFNNVTGAPYDPATVVAVLMNRYANVAAQKIDGFDLSYRQTLDYSKHSLNLFANASWLDITQRTLPDLPERQISGTISNAPELRSRAGVTYERGGVSVTGIVNYVDGSMDVGVTPSREIASWTTADLTIAYRFAGRREEGGTALSLSVTNLFDQDPPYAESPSRLYQGITFDSANSSVLGRFVAVSLRQSF
ncbi:TonB-dependent receptor [Parvularcula flava]|uniref:TonB-dependent receptor n=1 Tax=Aquisalinus luteolus TaxID=1566827 RepID=A0A8J3A0Z8_9PROT|nr:TonB-dependent receptor [Aquisalinus luteolus]NHK27167.1 TonB-dependent receptor [Aquisalinus luteolus]GGH94600.1 hypothetical protein GCM10011355_09170 [Aquisalinus luteolus]